MHAVQAVRLGRTLSTTLPMPHVKQIFLLFYARFALVFVSRPLRSPLMWKECGAARSFPLAKL